ncbi:Ig-like domain-containing protein [Ferruginibacter sp.]
MKNFYTLSLKTLGRVICFVSLIASFTTASAQKATVAIPIGIGNPCNSSSSDSVKYFDYNSTSNVITHRSNCKPSLAFPGFSDNLATISFSPFDGNLYFTQIRSTAGIFSSYTFRWLPNTCPVASAPVFRTFTNQFVAGVEFDPATGLGYQINFVDTTGYPPINTDATGNVGQFTSGAVVNGIPAMAYYDATGLDLKFVRSNDASGQAWGTPVSVSTAGDVGQYASMIIVNGNPAISYYDVTNGDLKYVRATDANGTAWGTPVTVEATNNIGQFTSLKIINGNPAISYYDVTNGDLRYVRAADANGAAWGAPVAFANANNVGQHTSLTVINGNPAISYYDVTNADLVYIRSSDANGAGWAAPVVVEATNTVGQFTSLVVVNGNPAISYYHGSNQDLKYVRATDVNGATWGAGVIVAAAGNSGQYTSMAVVNGNPGIAYYDGTGFDVKFVRATDVNGAAWGTAFTGEATGNQGQYASLIIANGNPAICYYDGTAFDAKFVRAYDANGSIWFKNVGIFKMELQEVNFTTGTLGISKPINYGSRYIYKQNGDVVMTPSGQLLVAFDNKYCTVNWKDYNTAIPLVATYIDTLIFPTGSNLVGLSYSDGKLVGSVRSSTACNSTYKEFDILTGAQSAITYSAGPVASLFTSADMTNITSGIGAAKRLISATENPVGSQIYDVVYEVVIKNYGGTPVTSVQAYDTLNKINGPFNAISGSITSFIAPAGITQNPLYNGRTLGNFNLLTPGSTLSNRPGLNTITLQITCRISNIQPGIVYNNQAVVTGVGLFGDNLRDSSTNGSIPDLNSNDKPDDIGEGQPTPLLISVAAQTPPCSALTNILYSQDFGTGTGLTNVIPAPVIGSGVLFPTGTTLYTSSVTQPIPVETYTITNNVQNANTTDFLSFTDHTGNANGRMLIVNADAANQVMYRGTFQSSLCANQEYSLSFYAAFVGNATYQTKCNAFGGFKYPQLKIRLRDGVSGLIITDVSTTSIPGTVWQQYGLKFLAPVSYTNIILELINDAPGGCGNDIAIDDIQFGNCDALPVVNVSAVSAGCVGSSTTFNSSLSDPSALPGTKDYQWQVGTSASGPWTDIIGAISSTYTIPAIAAGDTGKYYRVIIAATGNISNTNCRYISPGILLPGKVSSVAATSASRNKNNICPGISVSLSAVGGSLGAGASWRWYTGSPGGTLVGTGTTISVTPLVTTIYYVRAEGDCNTTTDQPVTVTISCDIDKDKDGIPDFVESNMAASFADANSNGVINAYDPSYAGYVDNNNDFINDNFQADGDADNDGIPNYSDPTFPGRIDTNADGIDDRFDTDKDGKINMLDLDSDNDGITDVVEAYGADTDGDGRIDSFSDTDGDGLTQSVDANNTGANNTGLGLALPNLDGDAVANFLDLDSDNDGIPDVVEAGGPDTNNNGIIDGFTDANNDGMHDSYINGTALIQTGADINADGKADSYPNKNLDRDFRPNSYDMDSDGDGIVDVIEAGLPDVNLDGIADGAIGANGWSTTVSAMPALNLRNTDGIGNRDYLDIDSDDDGIPDNIEGMSTAGYIRPIAATDTDGDGLVNHYDNVSGFGGSGIFVYDHDGDGIPDYLDLDTDSDGILDIVEGNDFNLNGMSDDLVTLTGLDTDGDGLDNRFDSLNSVTNIKGTSYNMGTGGSTSGDAAPGTKAPVQKKTVAQSDRDWRSVGVVLPVQFLNISGSLQNVQVLLSWSVITTKEVERFEIERSLDNTTYTKVGIVTDAVKLNEQQSFAYTDDISGLNNEVIYYRLKVVGKAGEIKYSNVLAVRKNQTKTPVSMLPNPANDYVSMRFFVAKESEVIIRLLDNLGKTVLIQKQKVNRGNNTILLNGLSKFTAGVYSIQIFANDEIVTQKLILGR